MRRKEDLYKKAVDLRHKGFSYNEILEHIPVAKSTISRWCNEIILTDEQKERLVEKKRNAPLIKGKIEQKKQSEKEAKQWAKDKILDLLDTKKDNILLISGILLYWAEGAHFTNKSAIEFTNTDSKMIIQMIKFFRDILEIPKNKLRIMIRLRDKNKIELAEKHWSNVTGIKRENFKRVEILEKTKKKDKHPLGICRIGVNDATKTRKLIFLIEEFYNKFVPVAQQDRARHS